MIPGPWGNRRPWASGLPPVKSGPAVRGHTILVFNQPLPPRPTQPGHPSVGRRTE